MSDRIPMPTHLQRQLTLWSFTEWLSQRGYAVCGPDGTPVEHFEDLIMAYLPVTVDQLAQDRKEIAKILEERTAAFYRALKAAAEMQ